MNFTDLDFNATLPQALLSLSTNDTQYNESSTDHEYSNSSSSGLSPTTNAIIIAIPVAILAIYFCISCIKGEKDNQIFPSSMQNA